MVTNERRGTGMYHVHNNIIMICVSLGTYFKIMRTTIANLKIEQQMRQIVTNEHRWRYFLSGYCRSMTKDNRDCGMVKRYYSEE